MYLFKIFTMSIWFKGLNDNYNQVKLAGFIKYLLDIDQELLEKMQPLGITPERRIYSDAELGNHYSQEDWSKIVSYWKEYVIKIYSS